MHTTIYKVVDKEIWDAAKVRGEFVGAAIDLVDGYIHLSTAEQVVETVAKHFVGQDNLLLLSVSTEDMQDDLKWEKSRNDQLFPHLYRPLKNSDVVSEKLLSMLENGSHTFPPDALP